MSKKLIIALSIIAGVLLLVVIPMVSMYNGLVSKDERAAESWAQSVTTWRRSCLTHSSTVSPSIR